MISTAATWAARAADAVLPDVVGRLPVNTKTLYLTFDDGPSHFSGELLDALQAAEVRATFFIRGDRIERHPGEAERIVRDGHGVGNHSFHHLDAWRNRWLDVADDLERGEKAIHSLTGQAPLWLRPPFGRFRRGTLKWCRGRARRLALWDVLAGDFLPAVDQSAVVESVVTQVRPGSLIVLHDGEEHQPQALTVTRLLLERLVDAEWSFDPLPDSGARGGN